MATELQVLGIRITVDDAEAAKLQNSLKAAGVETQALTGETTKLTEATKQGNVVHQEHAAHQEHLSSMLGVSRREAGFLTHEVAGLAGVTGGPALQAITALESGIGAAGIAFTGLALLAAEAKKAIEDHMKAEEEEAKQLATTSISLQEYSTRTKELRFEQLLLQEVQDVITKGATQAGYAFVDAAANMDKMAAAELKVGQFMGDMTKAQVEQDMQNVANAKSTLQYDQAVLKLAESFAPLNFQGKVWKDLTAEQQAAMIDLAKANGEYASFTSAAANQTVTFTDSIQTADAAVNPYAADIKKAADELDAYTDKALGAKSLTLQMADALKEASGGSLDARSQPPVKSAKDQPANDGSGRTWGQVAADNESEGKKIRDQALAEDKKMAAAQAQLTGERIAVEKIAGESAANTFDMIVAHAGDAADAVRLVKMWEATLAPNIRQQIDILVAAHLDGFLAALLGGGRGGAPGGPGSPGNQQGNQWDFTLSGETNATKQDYINRYGQTQAANDAWQRDHRQELINQGFTPPPTAEGGVVNYPQVRQVGEAGPEAIIPLDKLPDILRMFNDRGAQGVVQSVNHYNFILNTAAPTKSVLQDIAILKAQAGL